MPVVSPTLLYVLTRFFMEYLILINCLLAEIPFSGSLNMSLSWRTSNPCFILSQCDVVTINCPLYESTRNLINEETLKHFKKVSQASF